MLEELKSIVKSVGRKLNDTEAMVRSAVVAHCSANMRLKDDEYMIATMDFSKRKEDISKE
jgi:hypothetical protein